MFIFDAPKKPLSEHQTRSKLPWVEIVDAACRPLAVMNMAEARRQSLPFRAVAVLTYSAKHKLFLQKRKRDSEIYPGLYDISVLAPVRPNESRLEAALQGLLPLAAGQAGLKKLADLPPCQETLFACFTVFSTKINPWPGQPASPELDEGLLVDKNEWLFLLDNYKDTLSPFLLHFWQNKLLFVE